MSGRELGGVHLALEYLTQQNRRIAGDTIPADRSLSAEGKRVVVIGGGDTGSDCIGTSIRQGAKSVTNFEIMPQPPEHENKPLTWPYWPVKLRTSSSHQEGCVREFAIATKEFVGEGKGGKGGKLKALNTVQLKWQDGKMIEKEGCFPISEVDPAIAQVRKIEAGG